LRWTARAVLAFSTQPEVARDGELVVRPQWRPATVLANGTGEHAHGASAAHFIGDGGAHASMRRHLQCGGVRWHNARGRGAPAQHGADRGVLRWHGRVAPVDGTPWSQGTSSNFHCDAWPPHALGVRAQRQCRARRGRRSARGRRCRAPERWNGCGQQYFDRVFLQKP
jgi:hypothetical protein